MRKLGMRRRKQEGPASVLALTVMTVVAAAIVWSQYRSPSQAHVDTELEPGTHVTFVFIAPTSTGDKAFQEEVQRAKNATREFAVRERFFYSTVGVSDHWSVPAGLSILDRFGPFDEVVVGRNWFNLGVTEFISRMNGVPAVPQVVVTIQDIQTDTLPFHYGERVELVRLVGAGAVQSWAARNFPLTDVRIAQPR